jgi:hypothetical protein
VQSFLRNPAIRAYPRHARLNSFANATGFLPSITRCASVVRAGIGNKHADRIEAGFCFAFKISESLVGAAI